MHSLATLAQQRGAAALGAPALAPLLATLCRDTTAEMVVQYLLAHPGFAGAKDGPRRALAAAAAALAHNTPALLVGLSALLRPESNQPLAVRVEALQGEWALGLPLTRTQGGLICICREASWLQVCLEAHG